MSAWSEWTTCSKDGKECGHKWGSQSRNRAIIQEPSINGKTCPELTADQKCRIKDRYCNVDNTVDSFGECCAQF